MKRKRFQPVATIPQAFSYAWESQASQYPPFGPAGISLFEPGGEFEGAHCLLWRDDRGILRGILNYYSRAFPPHEEAGGCNVWVDPGHKGQGIATALVEEAMRLWDIDLSKQRFTPQGAAFAKAFLRKQASRQ